jgi:hypothetical protein
VVLAACTAVIFITAGTATAALSAPRGADALYQVEISGNVPGPQGGGSWFWLELDSDGGGIYAGSDCAHGGGGASADRGALSWEQQGDQLVIHGVVSAGLPPFAYEPILVRGVRPLRRDVRAGLPNTYRVSHVGRGRPHQGLRTGAGVAP